MNDDAQISTGLTAGEKPTRPHSVNEQVEFARLAWARPKLLLASNQLKEAESNLTTYRAKMTDAENRKKKAESEIEPDDVEVTHWVEEFEKWQQAANITERITIPNLRTEVARYQAVIRSAKFRLGKIGVKFDE
jgi:chromosome segregation ATPase